MLRKPSALVADRRANAVIELAITMPVLVMALFGVVTGGLIFDRYMTVAQVARVGASMLARGANFALDENKDLLLRGQELSIARTSGDGVVYLTRVVQAPAGTANEGLLVIAERHTIGDPSFAASAVGQPSPATLPLGESMYISEVFHSAESIRFGPVWPDPMRLSAQAYF